MRIYLAAIPSSPLFFIYSDKYCAPEEPPIHIPPPNQQQQKRKIKKKKKKKKKEFLQSACVPAVLDEMRV